MKKQCKGRIVIDSWERTRQCTRNAQPGKQFCKSHDPKLQQERRDARLAKLSQKFDDRLRAERVRHVMLQSFQPLRETLEQCLAALNFSGSKPQYTILSRNARDRANSLLASISADMIEAGK